MPDDRQVVALVEAARAGEPEAWHEIVDRYAAMVWGICRRFGLDRPDADDVGQTVWLSAFEHLGRIREPADLPRWIARITRDECLRVVRLAALRDRAGRAAPPEAVDGTGPDLVEEELLRARENIALRKAFARLGPGCWALLTMPSGEVRRRCLDELRKCLSMVALVTGDTWTTYHERHGSNPDGCGKERDDACPQRGNDGGEVRAERVVDR